MSKVVFSTPTLTTRLSTVDKHTGLWKCVGVETTPLINVLAKILDEKGGKNALIFPPKIVRFDGLERSWAILTGQKVVPFCKEGGHNGLILFSPPKFTRFNTSSSGKNAYNFRFQTYQ